MLKGILFALSACFIWGLIFVIPQLMSDYSSPEVVVGRYFFYGGFSFLLFFKKRLQGSFLYPLTVWTKALSLSFFSGYYLWVVLATRYASPEICALVLGISPITIALYGNWKLEEKRLKFLILPCLLIMVGLIMINVPQLTATHFSFDYSIGLIFSFISLISWTIYVVLNSRYLKNNPSINCNDWATIQGLAILFWTIVCVIIYHAFIYFATDQTIDFYRHVSWNESIQRFFIGCAILGWLCSWVGAYLWNKASVYLPVSLAGQLMIFETIFGLIFVYVLDQKMPSLIESTGMILLLGSVVYGIHSLALKSSIA